MQARPIRRTWIVACLAVLALGATAAEGEPSEQAQRDRLAAERDAAQARYEQAVRECERGFVVTSCIDRAKAERRATLDRVAREQAALDDAQRRRRADERRQRIADKQAQQAAAAQRSTAASAPQERVRTTTQSSPTAASRPGGRFESRSAEEAAAADAEAARRAAQSAERRARAKAHEEAVLERNAERAAHKPPAAPLPVPSAPAASALR
ncbi:MAG TPA: hypothetical protein VFZ28_00490 [Burkholderiaceae bacterium]|nr:hypothetical protein [Burkholderiaceae bacterium]